MLLGFYSTYVAYLYLHILGTSSVPTVPVEQFAQLQQIIHAERGTTG